MEILFAGLVALAPAGAPVSAQPPSNCPPGQTCAAHLSAEQLFYLADRLTERGATDRAIEILKTLSRDPRPDFRAEARVRIARLLQARGDREGALYWFRQLLDEKPDAAAVRIELAALLQQMGHQKAAVRELRRAEAAGLPKEVARIVRNAASVLQENAPLSASLSMGIAPDTNINSATTARTIDIFGLPFELSRDGRATSGIGLTFSGQIVNRAQIDRSVRLISEANISGNLYRESTFDDVLISADSGPELPVGHSRIRPSAVIGMRFFGQSRLYNFLGANLASLSPFGPKGQLELTASVVDFVYSAKRREQSGPSYSVGFAYDRVISPRLSVRLGTNLSRISARDSQYSSIGYTVDLLCSRDFPGLTAFARGVLTALNGDSDFSFFDKPRKDRVYSADAGLIFRSVRLLGLSPSIRMTYTHSNSIINLYRFRRLRFEASLEKTF